MKRRACVCLLAWVFAGAVLSGRAAGTNESPADDPLSLRAPYAEMPPTFYEKYTVLIWSGGTLLAAALMAGTWYVTRPRPRPVLPPEVEARRDLGELRDRTETGALLSRVSHVLRHYFERAFELGAGEMTTAEITATAAQSPRVGPGLAATLRDFLLRCDRTKFAPHGPEPPLGAVAEALRLVDIGEARRAELRQLEPKP